MRKNLFALMVLLLLALSLSGAQAEISLPGNLTVISDQAFEGNAAFRGVIDVPDGVHTVGNYAFKDTRIFGLHLPAAVSSIGEGILEGVGATYVTVDSASPSLAEGAFGGVYVIAGKPGGTVESWANRHGVPFYGTDSLIYHDGFAYAREEGNSVTLAFPTQPHSGDWVIPMSVGGMTVRGLSPTAFTNLTGAPHISLPDTVCGLPGNLVNWPNATFDFYPVIPDGIVYPPEVEQSPERAHEVDITPKRVTMIPGETFTPDGMQAVPVADWRRACTWFSSDESVAAVDESGVVTAVGPGTAGITAVVRIMSLNETSQPGEPIPEQVYYGVTVVDVVPASLDVDIHESALRLTTGQTHYSTFSFFGNGFMFNPTATLGYADSLGRAQDSAEPPVVSCELLEGGQILIQANTPGTATLTLNAEYMGKTASDVLEITVSEPEIELNFASLMTYPGYEYNLRVTSELPEGAAVAWTSQNPACVTVDENGHAVIGEQIDSTVIDCTVSYPDGAVAHAELPVMIREGIRWADAQDRTLYAGWEYHREYEDLQPALSCNLWPHDDASLTITAESSDERVLYFGYEGDMRVGYARYPGKAEVTYTASLNRPANEDETAPYTSLSRTFTATVVMPQMEACLGEQQISLLVGESRYVSHWENAQTDVHRQWFSSTDESVFTVTAYGQLIARGAGEAELVYGIESYGNVYEARATVTVTGWEIELDPGEVTLAVGESLTLVPRMALPEGETGEIYNNAAAFITSNDAIVRVDDKGLLTGRSAGTAVIQYQVSVREPAGDGMLYKPVTAYCTVHVVDPDAAITFDKPGEQALQNGMLALYPHVHTQLHAYDQNGSELQNVTWSLEGNSDGQGYITPDGLMTLYSEVHNKLDRVYVRASAQIDGREVSSVLTVTSAKAPMYISNCYVDHTLSVGDTSPWMMVLCSDDPRSMTPEEAWANRRIDIVSMDETIVRVTEDGDLYAVAPGITTMEVTLKTAEGVACDVSYFRVMVDAEPPVPNAETSIAFEKDFYFFSANQPYNSQNTNVILNQPELLDFYPINYSTSNPDIVNIDNMGNFWCSGRPGTATIYARIGNFIGKNDPVAMATVTVLQPEITATVTHADGSTQMLTNGNNAGLVAGETITLEIKGLPLGDSEGQIPPEALEISYSTGILRRTEQSELGDRQVFTCIGGGQGDLSAGIRLDPSWSLSFCSFFFDVTYPSVNYTLGSSPFFPVAVGERITLWPNFGYQEVQSVASSDERVLRIVQDESAPVAFEVVGEGRATVTAQCLLDDGATSVTASCEVLAMSEAWTLGDGYIPEVMVVGEVSYIHANIFNVGSIWPDVTLTLSDPTMMEIKPNGHAAWIVTPRKAGSVTLTITASKESGEPQSLSTEVLVTAPDALFERSNISLRPGGNDLMQLVINANSPVARVEWAEDGAGIVTLHTGGNADTFAFVTANTQASVDNRTLVTAKVFFEDGSYDYAACWVQILPDEQVQPNVWASQPEIELNVGESRNIGVTYDVNAEISGEFYTSSDENIVAVTANGEIIAKAPGEATVTYTVESYGVTGSADVIVRVRPLQASLNKSSITLAVGESEYLTAAGEQAPDHHTTGFYSLNENVANVDHLGLVTGLSAGQTTIGYHASVLGQPVELHCDVTITDPAQKLRITSEGSPVTRMTMQPYQEAQLGVQADGTVTGDIQWRVSNEDVLLVENGGLVKVGQAYGPGHTCYVSATATVDGQEQTAYCEMAIETPRFSIGIFPSAYQVTVGQATRIWYTIISNDPSVEVYPEFISSDENVATVMSASEQAGMVGAAVKGVSEGNCTVQLNLRDVQGILLASESVSVRVDMKAPTPMDEGVQLAFGQEAYFLNDSEGAYEVWQQTSLEGADVLRLCGYELVYESSDESVVEILGDGNMRAISAGEADVTAWFRGYEDGPRATAHVTVGKPEVKVTVTDRGGATHTASPGEDGAYEMEVGSYVTFELVNPPETTPFDWMNWGFDQNALTLVSSGSRSITLCPRYECTTYVSPDIKISGSNTSFTHSIAIRVLSAPAFDHPYLRVTPGETVDLWPAMNWFEIQDAASSDTNVVQMVSGAGSPVRFTAVGPGKATVSARVRQDDDTWVDLSSTVEVVENHLEILHLDDIPSVMVVDAGYDQLPIYEYNGFTQPKFDWEVSDETIIEIIRNEDNHPVLYALRPGTVTITACVTGGDVTKRMSKTVVVTRQPVSFATRLVPVRPDSQFTLPLYVDLEAANIREIRISTLDETIATAELITLDNGDPAALVTGGSVFDNTRVFADVIMADGSVYSAAAEVYVIPNWEIWANTFSHDIQLSTETWGSAPTHDNAWLSWDTNACLPDDPNHPGSDTAQIVWSIADESIARIDGFFTDENGDHPAWNNGPSIVAVGEGSTQLHAVLTLLDKDGNHLTQREIDFPITVTKPVVQLYPGQEIYEMHTDEMRHIEWGESVSNANPVDRVFQYSDDETIASFNVNGALKAMKPGETDIHYQIVFKDGTTFSASAHVIVTGMEAAFAEDSVTVAAGETIKPALTLNENGVTIFESGYETGDPATAVVLSDGTVYGVAPGTVVLRYWANTSYGNQEAFCTVNVTGEAPVLTLNTASLSLFPEQTAQLTPVYTGEGALENVTWSSSAPHAVQVDGNGLITTNRVNDIADPAYIIVTCEATANGQALRATCLITMKKPGLRILEYQFGEGCWQALGVDEPCGIYERYVVTDPSLTVERTITVDDPNVARYDAEYDVIIPVGQGHTFAHYTVTASNGECYTRDLFIRVNENCMPESVTPSFGVFVVPYQWGQHDLPLDWAPMYTGCYMDYTSSDPSILSFDEGPGTSEMYFHGVEGLVTVDITCPEDPSLNTQATVLVIDEQNRRFTLEAEDGSTVLSPGQTVQLVFKNGYGLDLSSEVRAIHYPGHFSSGTFRLTQDGQLTVLATENMSNCQIWADVELYNGYNVPVTYTFSVDANQPYLYLKQDSGADRFILAPRSGVYLQLCTNQTLDSGALQLFSSNPEIATVQQDENGLLVIGESAGEATISVGLPEAGLTASYPITVIEPTELRLHMSTSAGNVVRVGDEFEAYTSHQDPVLEHGSNLDRRHAYVSSDPSVLDTLDHLKGENTGDRDWMTFRALKPGTVTITSNAWLENYPEITDVDTMTITVIP